MELEIREYANIILSKYGWDGIEKVVERNIILGLCLLFRTCAIFHLKRHTKDNDKYFFLPKTNDIEKTSPITYSPSF